MDAEAIARGLSEALRRLVLVSDLPASAFVLSNRHGRMSSHKIGHFARRSPLYERQDKLPNYVTIWRLTPLGQQVRAILLREQGE